MADWRPITWVILAFNAIMLVIVMVVPSDMSISLGFALGVADLILVVYWIGSKGNNADIGRTQARLFVNYRPCPFCKERMRKDATVCPHCQSQSGSQPTPTM